MNTFNRNRFYNHSVLKYYFKKHSCPHTHILTSTQAPTHAYTHTHIHTHTHTHARTHTHTHTHSHTHKYTHTHTHTHISARTYYFGYIYSFYVCMQTVLFLYWLHPVYFITFFCKSNLSMKFIASYSDTSARMFSRFAVWCL